MKTLSKTFALTLLWVTAPVWSDVTVIRSLRLKSHSGDGSLAAQSVLQIHGTSSRRETQVQAEVGLAGQYHIPLQTITLISLDKKTVHALRFPNPRYEKIALSHWPDYLARELGPMDHPFEISQSWSRVLPADDEVKTIKGVPCRKFVYEWRFTLSNPETYAHKEYKVLTTLWLMDVTPALQQVLLQEHAFKDAYHKRTGAALAEDLNGIILQYAGQKTGMDRDTLYSALTQGTTRLKQITGYPLASRTEWFLEGYKTNKPLFTIESELDSISLKPLSAALFVPSNKTFSPALDEAEVTARLITRTE